MIHITNEYMFHELKTSRTISALSVFALVGFVIPLIPFMVLKTVNANSIISFLFLFLVFGLPFGYFVGAKQIKNTYKVYRDFRQNQFSLMIDTISDIKVSKNGRASEMDDSYCKLYLEKYSADKKSTVSVFASVCRKLREGDQCILVFVKSETYPVLVFPGNQYSIDEELNQYII